MTQGTWDIIEGDFRAFPETRGGEVSAEAFVAAFAAFPFPIDPGYREFVLRHGGGEVGSYKLFGLILPPTMSAHPSGARTAPALTEAFRRHGWPHVDRWLVFTTDAAGSPVGFRPDGTVALATGDTGEVHPREDDFERFVRRRCFYLPD